LKILYIYKTFPVLEYHTLEIFLALMNRQTKLPQQMQKLQTQIYLQFYSYRIKKCLVFFLTEAVHELMPAIKYTLHTFTG